MFAKHQAAFVPRVTSSSTSPRANDSVRFATPAPPRRQTQWYGRGSFLFAVNARAVLPRLPRHAAVPCDVRLAPSRSASWGTASRTRTRTGCCSHVSSRPRHREVTARPLGSSQGNTSRSPHVTPRQPLGQSHAPVWKLQRPRLTHGLRHGWKGRTRIGASPRGDGERMPRQKKPRRTRRRTIGPIASVGARAARASLSLSSTSNPSGSAGGGTGEGLFGDRGFRRRGARGGTRARRRR